MKTQEIKRYIIKEVEAGRIGVGTMNLYGFDFPTRNVNKAIRQLLDEGKISISCSNAGYRLTERKGFDAKLVEYSLKKKDFDIRLV